jgi:Zn-dependent protease
MPNISGKQVLWAGITFLIYNFIFGWQIALLIMTAIGYHEYCHLLAAEKLKLKTGGFLFLPFIGGVSFVMGKYKAYAQQAFVVLAGPIGGSTLAVLTYIAYLITGLPFLAASTYWILLVNLLNLAPFSFLDGGQVMTSIIYSINEKVGFYCKAISTFIAVFILSYFSIILALFIGFFGGMEVMTELRNRKYFASGQMELLTKGYLDKPEKMNTGQIILTSVVWAGAIVVLGGFWLLLKDNPESSLRFLTGFKGK